MNEFSLKTSMFRVRLAVHLVEIIFMCSFLVLLETQYNAKIYCQSKMDTCILHIYLFTCMPHAQLSLYEIINMEKLLPMLFQWFRSMRYGLYIFWYPYLFYQSLFRHLLNLGKLRHFSKLFKDIFLNCWCNLCNNKKIWLP